jgi:hypothetical protein
VPTLVVLGTLGWHRHDYAGGPEMIIGFFMFRGTGVDKNSPTFPRGGLAATFVIDLLDLWGTGVELDCDVEHKNTEDTSFAVAGSFATMNAKNVHKKDVSGLKEEVRLVFRVGGTEPANGVYVNVPAPSWRPY